MIEADKTIIPLEKGRYRIIKLIGEGSYGVVWKARCESDGMIVAIKMVQTRNPHKNTPYPSWVRRKIIDVQRWEIAFLKRIGEARAEANHILPLIDDGVFEDKPVIALLLCEGNLEQIYVKRCNREERRDPDRYPFDVDTLFGWIQQIASALAVVHEIKYSGEKYVHRDLKFDNVLIKGNKLYLSDFGTVRKSPQKMTYTFAGTPDWMAPEMLLPVSCDDQGRPQYRFDVKADIYAFGMLINALLTSAFPRAHEKILNFVKLNGTRGAEKMFGKIGGLNPEEQNKLDMHIRGLFTRGSTIVAGNEPSLPDIATAVEEFGSLIRSMLSPRAEKRPHASSVIERTRRVKEYLQPELSRLNLTVPDQVILEEPYILRIQARGRGLPPHGRWLRIRVDGLLPKLTSAPEIRPMKNRSGYAWFFTMPAFSKTGEHKINIHTVIQGQETLFSEKKIQVDVTSGQLWQKKHYIKALKRDPKAKWLNELEARTDTEPDFKAQYEEILQQLCHFHPDNTDINGRYWDLKRDEDGSPKPALPKLPLFRWLRHAALILLLFIAVVGGMMIYPYVVEKFKSDLAAELLASAETALSEKQWEKAIKLAAQTMQSQPENQTARNIVQKVFDSYIESGQAQLSVGFTDTAKPYVEKCDGLANDYAFLKRDRLDDLKGRIAARKDTIGREQNIRTLVETAKAELAQRKWKQAQQSADEILQYDPEQAVAQHIIQSVYDHKLPLLESDIREGRTDSALKRLTDIKRMKTQYGFIRETANLEALARQIDEQAKLIKIAALLIRANVFIDKKALTTPSRDNAYELYQQVLALDPNNKDAIAGFRRIADEYHDIAVKDAKRLNITGSLDWINKGLAVFEQHESLLNLKSELEKAAKAFENAEKAFSQDSLEAAKRYARDALKSDYFKDRARSLIVRIDQREKEGEAKPSVVEPPDSKRKVMKTEGRYIAFNDGTVYDKANQVWWAATDNGESITCDMAKIYCEKEFKNGGWRMPTTNELRTLYDDNSKQTRTAYGLNVKFATNLIKLTSGLVWTSENKNADGSAAAFSFDSGGWYWAPSDGVERALPVRVGN